MIEAAAFLVLGLWVAWLVVPSQAIWSKRLLLMAQAALIAAIMIWWLS